MLEALHLDAGAVSGVRLRGCRGQGMREIEASDVVMATGGIGALFAATTNPPGADGAGLALALLAGAAARDLEFVQFHPTALDVPGMSPLPLVTEALRGAGAVLVDEGGARLMPLCIHWRTWHPATLSRAGSGRTSRPVAGPGWTPRC